MAVIKLKKIRLVAHRSWKEPLLSQLQDWEMLHLVDTREKLAHGEFAEYLTIDPSMNEAQAEEAKAQISFVLSYLRRYDTEQEGMIESFLALKSGLSQDQMEAIVRQYDGLAVAERCRHYEKRLSEIATAANRLNAERAGLQDWVNLDIAPRELSSLSSIEAVLGAVPLGSYDTFAGKLTEVGAGLVHIEEISRSPRDVKVLVVYPHGDQAVTQALRESVLARANLNCPHMPPVQAVATIDEELKAINAEKEEIIRASRELLADKVKLQALYDYYDHLAQKQKAVSMIADTGQVFFLGGWVQTRDLAEFEQRMAAKFPDVVVLASDPEDGDNPPVLLENSKIATPFEFVMNVYGWPQYFELDPTTVLAPFFLLFFAIALGDAGYGLILAGVSVWFMRKYDLDKYGKKFFRLFLMGGLLTVAVGFALNGFFGNLIDLTPFEGLRRIKNSMVLLDPMSNPLGMMILTVLLGTVHVWTGFAVKGYATWKGGDPVGAILDSGSWMFWIAALLFYAVAGNLPSLAALAPIAKYTAMAGAAIIVLTQGRGAKSIIGKLGGGLYALYNTVGPFSDTLSYTRLLALGLSGSVIAMVINTFAMMVKDIPVIGWLIMIALLVFGHIFNLVLALLGCFIHSARLQYVEFFTKFFEGGGAPFRPFRRESKYTVIKG